MGAKGPAAGQTKAAKMKSAMSSGKGKKKVRDMFFPTFSSKLSSAGRSFCLLALFSRFVYPADDGWSCKWVSIGGSERIIGE